ncbi:MAG TPA: cache domain-containing protein, partial [Mucilaginibacter sp.]
MNNWTVENVNAPHGNFSTRDYFKRIINNKPYWFKHYLFSLDQVTSRTTGIFTSVIAIPVKTDSAKVAAMSFDMKSLINVVMPDGYQFAIIDNNGRVLYHYLPDRNLNENLKNEFADSTKLVSSLQAKSDTSFAVEYFGKPYVIKMKPIEGLPYFMVIFEDVSYNDTRDTEVYVFTISMLIGLIFFLVIQFIIVFFVSSKRSFFKKQVFETSWVGPKTNSRRQYNQAIIGNLVVTALLVVFYNFCSFLEYLYLILFSITFIGIFLNAIFAIKYKKEQYLYRFKIRAIGLLCAFVIVIDAAAFFTLDINPHFLWLIFFELVITGTCLFFYYQSTTILAIVRSYRAKFSISWSYNQSFALMATTRLIITSGIPVFLFYTYAYNYEQNISTRYKQLTFANALTQKIPQKVISGSGIDSVKGVYGDGTFIKDIKIDSNIRISTTHNDSVRYTKEDLITVNILSAFRFYRSDKSVKDDNLNLPNVGNRIFFNRLLRGESSRAITYRQVYR